MTKAILAGVSAVAMLAISNGASASVLDSGGGTLAAKLYRDIFNCYSTTSKTGTTGEILVKSAPASYYDAQYPTTTPPAITYPTKLPSQCTSAFYNPAHTDAIDYLPVGSGAGQTAFIDASPVWGLPAAANPVAWLSTALGITTLAEAETEFDFSGSDAFLTTTQIASASTAHSTVIQFPGLLTPIDVSYNTTNGGAKIELRVKDVCGIFGGTITDWSQVSGYKGTASGPITVVVRADGSGTSAIFSNYLLQVCDSSGVNFPGFTLANGFSSTKPSWSAAVAANGGSFAGFVSASGSGGVSAYVEANPGSVNYISPDYVGTVNGLPDVKAAEIEYPNSKYPTGTPSYVAPSSTAITKLAAAATPPSSADAYSWGEPINNAILAQDTSYSTFPKGAYPIGGFTFIETYACPANPTSVSNLFSWYFNSSMGAQNTQGYTFIAKMLSGRGFAAVPTNFQGNINTYIIPEINSGC